MRIASMLPGAVFAAAALWALVGCDDGPVADTGGPVDDGLLELGAFAQSRAFEPYAAGDEEVVEMGLQGGFHIFVDGRLHPDGELDECVVDLVLTRSDDGSEITRIRHQRVPDIPDADGWPTLPEMIIFIPDPAAVDGQDVHVRASVETLEGTLLDVVEAELFLTSGA